MLQIIVNSLCAGAGVALFALAFNVVYLPAGVFYIAIAGVYALAPYLALQFYQWGAWPSFAVIGALLLGAGVSMLMCWANHAWITRRKLPSGTHLVSSLGLYMIITQVIALSWGNNPQVLRVGIGRAFSDFGVIVADSQLLMFGSTVVLVALFFCLLHFGNLGLRLRALADNPNQMALLGYNTDRLYLVVFGIAGVFASVAGMLSALDFGFSPHVGMPIFLLAVAATVIGGKNTFAGPVLGGFILGFVRVLSVRMVSAQWQDAITFVVLALFLFFCSNGLLGGKSRLEAVEA